MVTKHKTGAAFLIAAVMMVVFTALFAFTAFAVMDTTRPTIFSVSPANNQIDIATNEVVTVRFSEQMDPNTINENTVTVLQWTTPSADSPSSAYRSKKVEGVVTYTGVTATFTPNAGSTFNPLQPSQEYGNVFTVTVTSGAKDLAGNSLSRDYLWSFTTGGDAFNTGAMTSQQDQSAAPGVVTPAVVPTTQPAVTAAPVASAPTMTVNPSSWASWVWWAIGGALLLLLVVVMVAFSLKPTRQKNIKVSHVERSDGRKSPFGDVHPVKALEGIGPKYNNALQAIGIMNTKQLWNANAATVARKTGAASGSVKSWQAMAELASVKDIGPQYAELLERSGIHSIAQLKAYDTDKLLKLVRAKENSLDINIQGNSPGHATVENWIDQARDHKFGEQVGQTA